MQATPERFHVPAQIHASHAGWKLNVWRLTLRWGRLGTFAFIECCALRRDVPIDRHAKQVRSTGKPSCKRA